MHRGVYLQRRWYSLASRWRNLLSGESNKANTPCVEAEIVRPTQEIVQPLASLEKTEQHLKEIAGTLSPYSEVWSLISLTDIHIKSKVLLSCETELGRKVANTDLGSLQTLDDLWSLFSRQPYQQVKSMEKEGEEELFPSLMDRELPSNLSVQLPHKRSTQAHSQRGRRRRPFQNFDNPRHSKFHHKRK